MKYTEFKDNQRLSMDPEEKAARLELIEIGLKDLEKIIDTMEEKGYAKEDINEYYKKRWELWTEQHRIKKS